jgi:uncharacterized membrane protein affecting hemolysin expression
MSPYNRDAVTVETDYLEVGMYLGIPLFRNMSIRTKLTMLMVLTSMIVLLLASAAFIANDVVQARAAMVEGLDVQAEIIGKNGSAALVFNDAAAANEILSALSAEPGIMAAAISTTDGEMLASYISKDSDETGVMVSDFWLRDDWTIPADMAGNYYSWDDNLELYSPISLDGEMLGMLYIKADLKQINEQLVWDIVVFCFVFVVSIVVAFILATLLQRFISEPILQLAKTMELVKSRQD